MRRLLAGLVFASLAACTIQNTEKGSGSPSGDPSSTSPTSDPDGGSSSSSSSSNTNGPSSGEPTPSQTQAEIDIDGTCSAFAACGGNPQGTFDYTGGCIEDVFRQAREACPALDTTKATVKVKGSITFIGNALKRNVTLTTSGTIVFPASCTYGQCAMVEQQLKSAFASASCSGSTDCTCTVSRTDTEVDGTTYTISNGVVTTADGDQYSLCEKGADLSYSGVSAGSEQGTFTLKKR